MSGNDKMTAPGNASTSGAPSGNPYPAHASGSALPVECHGLDTPERVCFYEQDFYPLSNFSAFTLYWKGLRFDTSEAASGVTPSRAFVAIDVSALAEACLLSLSNGPPPISPTRSGVPATSVVDAPKSPTIYPGDG